MDLRESCQETVILKLMRGVLKVMTQIFFIRLIANITVLHKLKKFFFFKQAHAAKVRKCYAVSRCFVCAKCFGLRLQISLLVLF